jgi:penicillin-binding protein 1A
MRKKLVAEHMKVLQAQFDEEWKKRNRNPWVDDDGQEIRDFLARTNSPNRCL